MNFSTAIDMSNEVNKKKKERYEFKNLYGSELSKTLQKFVIFLLSIYFHSKYKIEVEYTEAEKDLDKDRNYILAVNHRSLNDPPLLASVLGAPVSFLAKQELFSNPLLGYLISSLSAIPVDRENTGSSTIKIAKKILSKKGWRLVVFIEGTRSRTGSLGTANNGAVFLSRLTKAPIVPAGISYREGKKIIIKIGSAYMPDSKAPIQDESDRCLELISHLCDYEIETT